MPLLLFLFSLTLPALAQSDWDKSRTDANEAYRDGRYTQAEALLKRALEAARNLGPDDPRVADIHEELARVYSAESKYAEAEGLLRAALSMREKSAGLESPELIHDLEFLAANLS